MRKRIFCLMMAAALSLGMALPVLAEDHESRKNWQVTFDGSKMGSNVSAAEMAEEVSSIQPGDSIRLSIALKNSSSRATGWYMSNKVIETLEDDSSTASGGAYTYLLTYTDPRGVEDVLFSNEALGGEDAQKGAGEGLKQATGSLEDYFFLDTLENGQSGKVYLTVSQILDPDTPRAVIARSVQTGDPTQILPYCAAALAAGILLQILGIMAMKRRGADSAGADEEGGSQG